MNLCNTFYNRNVMLICGNTAMGSNCQNSAQHHNSNTLATTASGCISFDYCVNQSKFVNP